MKAKYENKFIVVNTKYLDYGKIPRHILGTFFFLLKQLDRYVPDNKYIVCNQDEIYADEVLKVILDGESRKSE